MVGIYLAHTPMAPTWSDVALVMPLLAPEAQTRASRYASPDGAIRTLIGELLARFAIRRKFGPALAATPFQRNRHGKPHLPGKSGCHFSISHSGRLVAAAVSTSPVGIDVERVRPINPDLARRFFSNEECAMLAGKSGREWLECFFDLWTLKESYLKAMGKGLTLRLDSFSMTFEADSICVLARGKPAQEMKFGLWPVRREYRLAVCGSEKPGSPKFVGGRSLRSLVSTLAL